ncbi:SAM-dependent methyltransferase [Patescibacteria group bacterium]|nr:SAM-dependent methyltransferase [Patescibacteria group bacterium]MBU0847305.1 SAM-dependent methyltransferase [Patescibacteria group bacterium]
MQSWLKILQQLEPISQSKKLHEQIYAMLRKAPDFTPDTADQFKEEQELLGKILLAYSDFQRQPKYGHEDFGDMFGEYLVESEQLIERAGQFFTPVNVVKMMAEMILDPKEGDEAQYISDPAAGCGRYMLKTAEIYHKKTGSYNFLFHNVDIDFRMYVYCTMNAILHAIPSVNIWGNSLSLEFWEGMVVFAPMGLPVQWHYLDKDAVQIFVPKFEARGQQTFSKVRQQMPRIISKEQAPMKAITLFDALK